MKKRVLKDTVLAYLAPALKNLPVVLFCLLQGCSVAPSENEVRDIIVKYFSAKGYEVTEIIIGDIKPIEISKYQYMGTKGYIVDVRTITLQPSGDIGTQVIHRKGERLSFKNGTIQINKKTDKTREWLITDIKGILII